jgi:ABC-type glycerol-3-phosphate transport system substrate-binding protein
MPQKISRREMLKVMATGSAAVAASPLLNAAAAPKTVRAQGTRQISFWQPPIWRYGADNKTVVGAGSDDWITDAVKRFEAANPSIKVNLELIPWDTWPQKTATAFANGQVPNVLYGNWSIDKVMSGLIDPIDDFVSKDMLSNWVPGAQDALTVLGRLYGVPAFLNPDMAALSKTALEKYGGADLLKAIGDDRSGLTFDLMTQFGKQFSDGKSRYFFGIPTDHSSVLYWGFGAWLNGWGVKFWDDAQERFIAHEQDAAVTAFQWLVDAQNTAKILIPNLPKWSDVDNFYWNLNAAMRIQWPGIQTELETAQAASQAQKDFEIVLAGHPHTKEAGPFITNNPPVQYTIGRTNDSSIREAAFTFANWLATDDSNATGWFVNGFFPSTKSGLKAVANHPFAQDPNRKWVLEQYLLNYKPGFASGNWNPNINARTAKIFNSLNPFDFFMQEFQSLLLGKVAPKDMLQAIAAKVNGALGVKI